MEEGEEASSGMKKCLTEEEGAHSTRLDLRDSAELLIQLGSSSREKIEHEISHFALRRSFDGHRPGLLFHRWRRSICKFDEEEADDRTNLGSAACSQSWTGWIVGPEEAGAFQRGHTASRCQQC